MGLAFELTRPERTDAMPDGPILTTGLSEKVAGRGRWVLNEGVDVTAALRKQILFENTSSE
jgi:hypothetical protein